MGVRVYILSACQFHQTSYIGIRCCDNIRPRKSHQDHYLRMVFSFILFLIIIIEFCKLVHQFLCLAPCGKIMYNIIEI